MLITIIVLAVVVAILAIISIMTVSQINEMIDVENEKEERDTERWLEVCDVLANHKDRLQTFVADLGYTYDPKGKKAKFTKIKKAKKTK